MSVQRDLAVGYGIVISIDKVEEIKETMNDEEYEEFLDCEHIVCLNSWIGDDYFLGVVNWLGSIENPLPINDVTIDTEEIKAFEDFLAKQPWRNLVAWEPETYLIEFVF